MKRWLPAVRSRGHVRHPAVRLCLAADVERYGRFTNLEAARAQERFVEIFRRAREHASLAEHEFEIERSGDGQFAVLRLGVDESVVVPGLVTGLAGALRQINADLSTHARLRLRVALHRGLLAPDVNGWVGHSAIAVHRLLDSDDLRAALTREPAADFVLMVADSVYRDVIAQGFSGLAAERFQQVIVDIPTKRFTELAWIFTAG